MTPEQIEGLLVKYSERLAALGLNVLSAAAILIIGLWIAAWAGRAVRRLSKRSHRIDETLAAFFAWIVRYAITGVVLIAVLRRFGVETTSVVALFGAAALAIGLALQGTLSNLAAGVMLMLFRPYRLGDSVELNGRGGVVTDINLFVTEIVTPDHAKITLPNGQCWGAPISNYTAFANRRIDLDFAVPNAIPIERAMAIAEAALKGEKRIEDAPAPAVQVKSIEFDRTTLTAQGWARAGEQVAVRQALIKAIKLALDKVMREPKATEQPASSPPDND